MDAEDFLGQRHAGRELEPIENHVGEFFATSNASSENEKQTFLRSKNVYGIQEPSGWRDF